ncbi:MAG: chalcone isomerase family protein [Gemmatimonadota bacterium]|nr:MAG: chalcone isomerase family protein [Gemmatimonadota bacterium]
MARPLALLAAVAAAAAPLSAQQADSVSEPSSKVPFPVELEVPDGAARHVLTGTGIRVKTFLKVKVYAFGLYVDPDGARSALADYADRSARDLERDQAFYGRILDQDFAMTLRLVMTRDVGGDDMADAFDGALRPRVQHAAAAMDMPGGEQALDQVRGYFSLGEMTKGAEIVFSWAPDGILTTAVKGGLQPAIESAALCWALFDVYLGQDPISGDGKKRVVARFPQILAGG